MFISIIAKLKGVAQSRINRFCEDLSDGFGSFCCNLVIEELSYIIGIGISQTIRVGIVIKVLVPLHLFIIIYNIIF